MFGSSIFCTLSFDLLLFDEHGVFVQLILCKFMITNYLSSFLFSFFLYLPDWILFFHALDLEGVACSLVEDDGVIAFIINSLVNCSQELLALPVLSSFSIWESRIVVDHVGKFWFLALILLCLASILLEMFFSGFLSFISGNGSKWIWKLDRFLFLISRIAIR